MKKILFVALFNLVMVSVASANPQVCTMDINEYGYSSHCDCNDSSKIYNPQSGKCEELRICTLDINEHGNPSNCSCSKGKQNKR